MLNLPIQSGRSIFHAFECCSFIKITFPAAEQGSIQPQHNQLVAVTGQWLANFRFICILCATEKPKTVCPHTEQWQNERRKRCRNKSICIFRAFPLNLSQPGDPFHLRFINKHSIFMFRSFSTLDMRGCRDGHSGI